MMGWGEGLESDMRINRSTSGLRALRLEDTPWGIFGGTTNGFSILWHSARPLLEPVLGNDQQFDQQLPRATATVSGGARPSTEPASFVQGQVVLWTK